MILNTQIHNSAKVVSGKLGNKMTAYYTDGTDFKTGNSNESIQVALNSVLVTESISDHTVSGGLTSICTQQGMVTTLAVYRVTDNFKIA